MVFDLNLEGFNVTEEGKDVRGWDAQGEGAPEGGGLRVKGQGGGSVLPRRTTGASRTAEGPALHGRDTGPSASR